MLRLAIALLLVHAHSPLAAQAPRVSAPRVRLAIGSVATSAWLRGDDGLRVSARPGPMLGAGLAWSTGRGSAVALSLRGAWSPLALEDADARWGTGSVFVVDAVVALERAVHARASLRGGVGAAHVRGPSDVTPFAEAAAIAPLLEAGVSGRVSTTRALHASLAAQALRFGTATVSTPTAAGTVWRAIVEVRHGR